MARIIRTGLAVHTDAAPPHPAVTTAPAAGAAPLVGAHLRYLLQDDA
ncbi:hypothetical protein ACWGLE_12945 [Streptomyces sp. NPDC055897]